MCLFWCSHISSSCALHIPHFAHIRFLIGCSPCLLPPLVHAKVSATVTEINAWHVIQHLEQDVMEAHNNLLKAKNSQSNQANKHHFLTFLLKIDSLVWLLTLHHQNNYKAKGEHHVVKFPRYDSPYTIIATDEEPSTITLDLLNSPSICLTFPTSKFSPTLNLTFHFSHLVNLKSWIWY